MGRRSVKENKNAYQLSREKRGLTRDAASSEMEFISPERIEKIESEKTAPQPDEVMAMESCYKDPALSNYYCTHECPIGKKYVPEAKEGDLPQVTVELLAALNALGGEKDRLIEISVDGRVNDFEREDFDRIIRKLSALDRSIGSMRLWLERAYNEGRIDEA